MVIHAFGDEHTLGWKYCDSAAFSKYKQWLDTNILRLNRDEKTYTPLNNSVWIEKLCGKLKCSFKLYAKKGNTNLDTFNSVITLHSNNSLCDSINTKSSALSTATSCVNPCKSNSFIFN